MKAGVGFFSISALLVLALAPIAIIGHEFKLIGAALTYFSLTLLSLKATRISKTWTIVCITIPVAVLYLPVFFSEDAPISSLPSTIFHFVGILFGSVFFFTGRYLGKIALLLGLIFLTAFMFFSGNAMWLHKVNYGTFTGRTVRKIPDFQLTDELGTIYNKEKLKDKTVIIDFWTTSCFICFKKFPLLEELHIETKRRSDLVAYAVNVPINEESRDKAINMVRERDFSFPILFADPNSINKQFDFNSYPTVFILKDNKIVYCGGIENVETVLATYQISVDRN
jgi:thiol-disulfide isomerase/thioredoxin